jgi:hypothetical protein
LTNLTAFWWRFVPKRFKIVFNKPTVQDVVTTTLFVQRRAPLPRGVIEHVCSASGLIAVAWD